MFSISKKTPSTQNVVLQELTEEQLSQVAGGYDRDYDKDRDYDRDHDHDHKHKWHHKWHHKHTQWHKNDHDADDMVKKTTVTYGPHW